MTTKIVFHGSDIEKICEYYHLNKEDIVKFGANVNRLDSHPKSGILASNIDNFFFLSGSKLYFSSKYNF